MASRFVQATPFLGTEPQNKRNHLEHETHDFWLQGSKSPMEIEKSYGHPVNQVFDFSLSVPWRSALNDSWPTLPFDGFMNPGSASLKQAKEPWHKIRTFGTGDVHSPCQKVTRCREWTVAGKEPSGSGTASLSYTPCTRWLLLTTPFVGPWKGVPSRDNPPVHRLCSLAPEPKLGAHKQAPPSALELPPSPKKGTCGRTNPFRHDMKPDFANIHSRRSLMHHLLALGAGLGFHTKAPKGNQKQPRIK